MDAIYEKIKMFEDNKKHHPIYRDMKSLVLLGDLDTAIILTPNGYLLGCYKPGEKHSGIGLEIISIDRDNTIIIELPNKRKILKLRDFLNEFIESHEDDMII